MRLYGTLPKSPLAFLAVLVGTFSATAQESTGVPQIQATQAAPATPTVREVEAFIRRQPVLPISLPDYELTTLDITKEAVLHVGDQTYFVKLPIFVYVPTTRAPRAKAVDRLVECRLMLLKAAASREVTTADLAGLRVLIEEAIKDLRGDLPEQKVAEITLPAVSASSIGVVRVKESGPDQDTGEAKEPGDSPNSKEQTVSGETPRQN